VRIYDSVIVSHVDTYRSNTNCAPAPQPEVHDFILMRCLSTSMHCLMYRLGLQNARQQTLLYIRLEFLRGDLGYTRRCPWPRPTWTLSSVFAANISIAIVVSSYCGYFRDTPTLTTRTAHQKIVDILLELLPTPRYISSILSACRKRMHLRCRTISSSGW